MKNILYISAMLLVGGVSLTGCSDFLEADNKSNLDSDAYFVTEDGFENLSTTPYYKLRAIYGDDPVLFCSGTDLYERGRSNYSDVTLSLYKDLNSSNSNVLDFYEACYDGIQQCNTVLYYAGQGAKGDNVQRRVSEAKYLKAFYYYLLSQQFGGVPISDTYISSVITSFPRESLKDVYDYIIGILTEIETDNVLPLEDYTGRVSMRAVYNLFAKVYLAYGWDCGTTANEDGSNVQITDGTFFAKAAEYADKAINGKVPALTFSQMWDVANDNNDEIMFAIQYTRGISGQDELETGNKQEAMFANYYNEECKYTTSQYPASEKLIYLFEPGDERFEGTFMVTHYSDYKSYYTGTDANSAVYAYYPAWYEDLSKLADFHTAAAGHAEANIYSTSNPSKYIKAAVNKRTGAVTYTEGSQSYETSRTTTGASLAIRKFDDYTATRNTTKAVSYHNIVLAHLTETYLLAAEAYYMAGDAPTSLNRLNVVRRRANATELTSYSSYVRHYSDGTDASVNMGAGIGSVPYETNLDPVDVILDERARELCGEYYRWMDLRRTKRLIDYNVKYNSGVTSADQMKGADGKYRWYRPFPQDEINLNDAITDEDQNDGYK